MLLMDFDVTNGVLSLIQGINSGFGSPNIPAAVTVDLDGRYKLDSAQDVAIANLHFNTSNGTNYAERNDGTNTPTESVDGRYFNDVSFMELHLHFTRSGGTDKIINLIPRELMFQMEQDYFSLILLLHVDILKFQALLITMQL